MYRAVDDRLANVTLELRRLVEETSTRDVVVHIAPYLYGEAHSEFHEFELGSPYGQFRILSGVLAETEEPLTPIPLTTLRKHRLLGTLQALPEVLDESYQPETSFERYKSTHEETQTFFVRYLSHMQHFDATSATTIQLIERLFNVVQWHPNELSAWLGFKVQHLFSLLHATVLGSFPGALDAFLALSWADQHSKGRVDPNVYHRVDIDRPIGVDPPSNELMYTFQHRFKLLRGALKNDAHDILDQGYASEHPLLVIDTHEMYSPPPKYLIETLLSAIVTFERERYRSAYVENIGNLLERQTHRALARHFGENELFRDIKIGPKQRQKDHILSTGRTVLCVESKGVKLNEIDRNTRRGYAELRSNFKKGVYDALEQAQDAVDHLRDMALGKSVQITGKDVSELAVAQDATYTNVAITDMNYGMLAKDLHSLRGDVPRPSVAMSAYELEMLSDCIAWRGWHGSALAKYLEERAALDHLVRSPEEMHLAAIFMATGTLKSLLTEDNRSAVVHSGADYIGALYMAWLTKSDAPLEGYNIRNLSEDEQKVMRNLAAGSYKAPERKPTDKCTCRSGKMLQECHGGDVF